MPRSCDWDDDAVVVAAVVAGSAAADGRKSGSCGGGVKWRERAGRLGSGQLGGRGGN